MFKKLLSNLPFNPGLITQVSFYTKRMKQESAIRRTALVFMSLTMVVQFFAVISPPQSSLAASGNDIIPGGFSSKASAINYCNQNSYNFRDILQRFGVTCANLSASTPRTIKSTDHNRKLLSLGRFAYGKAGERAVSITINGQPKTFYQRYLWAWDSGAYSSYTALVGTTNDGAPFMVLYNCGNITVVESSPAPPPPPQPVNRTPAMNFSANCSAIAWKASDLDGSPRIRIYIATNTGNTTTDWNNKGSFAFDAGPKSSGTVNEGSWAVPTKYRNSTTRYRVFAVVSDRLPNGQVDDVHYVRATPTGGALFGPCTQAPPPPPEPPQPPQPPTDVCPNIPGTQTSTSECKPCDQASNNDAKACIVQSKSARNTTKGTESASSLTASSNDEIIYTLSVRNTGKVAVHGYVIEETISDVLDYAVLTNHQGAKLVDGHTLRWEESSIAPGATVQKRFAVKIKDPIPQTPTSSSDPGHFDGKLTNFYGNTVTVTVDLPPIKQIEITTTTTLPSTGPGTSLVIGFVMATVIAYFFARSRLFATELDIVRMEYAQAGGA